MSLSYSAGTESRHPRVSRPGANPSGVDYITGDIHGSFDLLSTALAQIDFDESRDRLFCTGDLVDRGPDSADALDWLQKPWFHACMGNHDAQYVFAGEKLDGHELFCLPYDPWPLGLDDAHFLRIRKALATLPWAIEVERQQGLAVGIVHAGVPLRFRTWADFTGALEAGDEPALYDALWERDIARLAISLALGEVDANTKMVAQLRLPDIAHVFHGHTRAKKLGYRDYAVANRHYIDTSSHKLANRADGESVSATLCLWRLDDAEEPALIMAGD